MVDQKYEFPIEELTKGASGEVSKADRVTRLQPDIEGTKTKFYFPFVVWVEGQGLCKWTYNPETSQLEFEEIELKHYHRRPDGGMREMRTGEFRLTTLQMQVDRQEQP